MSSLLLLSSASAFSSKNPCSRVPRGISWLSFLFSKQQFSSSASVKLILSKLYYKRMTIKITLLILPVETILFFINLPIMKLFNPVSIISLSGIPGPIISNSFDFSSTANSNSFTEELSLSKFVILQFIL